MRKQADRVEGTPIHLRSGLLHSDSLRRMDLQSGRMIAICVTVENECPANLDVGALFEHAPIVPDPHLVAVPGFHRLRQPVLAVEEMVVVHSRAVEECSFAGFPAWE